MKKMFLGKGSDQPNHVFLKSDCQTEPMEVIGDLDKRNSNRIVGA